MKKRILSLLLTIAMIVALFPATMTVYAEESGKCGNFLEWTLDNNGTLTISGTSGNAYMWDYSSSDLPPWYDSRSNIKHIIINKFEIFTRS